MQEDLLHFIWKTNKLVFNNLKTSSGKQIIVKDGGLHNHHAGPDFFNAKVIIDGQLWAGNVEMHLKSSDWYAHGHEVDINYDNVILHVVWEDDVAVFRKDRTEIPTLELKDIVPISLLEAYSLLLYNSKKKFVNCEKDFSTLDTFAFDHWLERLFFERLEQKAQDVYKLLQHSENDWEAVLFTMLLKGFGSKVNGAAYTQLSSSLPFATVRKLKHDALVLESVLMGQCGLLTLESPVDGYLSTLQKEYTFQKAKFQLEKLQVTKPSFFGLRPNSFPTIRLSQLSQLYATCEGLFNKIMTASTVDEIYRVFNISASEYWTTHYTFGKLSKPYKKKLTKSFVDLLIINAVLPLKFAYSTKTGLVNNELLLDLIRGLSVEKNTIISAFDAIGPKTLDAFESQAKLQLYNHYCSKNRCLQCEIGASLLNKNS
ncbi:DUF2851 family protein [uncultured Croceitalea sp.]|uniref:DUF2851 family protein n=1 Tax=uncultured Croceitalea sp. TaxID=1798908 RepID=UPI003306047D